MTPQTSFVVVAPPETAFPDPERAPASGLVAFGGELTVERLIDAGRRFADESELSEEVPESIYVMY